MKRRYGHVIGLKAEKVEEYRKLHSAVWPGVLDRIKKCNIRNYSIYIRQIDDGNFYLFSYFEYIGDDFTEDMKKMAADQETQRWWALCKPLQAPLKHREEVSWWSDMEEVFHCP